MKKEIKKPEHNDPIEVFETYEKANFKKYKKMCKRFKKELRKVANEFGPWDECYVFEFMRVIFKAWIDYYTLGVNVMGMEKQDEAKDALESNKGATGEELSEQSKKYYEEVLNTPTRLEIATKLLELLELEEDTFWQYTTDGSHKEMKDFVNYFAEYIHYMWD